MKCQQASAKLFFCVFVAGIFLAACQSREEMNEIMVFEIIQGNAEQVEKLIQKGADVNYRSTDGKGYTPLHQAVLHEQTDIIRLLAEHHADFTAADANGYSAAHTCVIQKKPHCLKTLIELDAPIDLPGTICGLTPLFYAVTDNQPDMVRLLIENGCRTTIRAKDGSTLLHKAAFHGYADICRLLLEKGLDSARTDNAGKTALDIAQEAGNKGCAAVLSGADTDT